MRLLLLLLLLSLVGVVVVVGVGVEGRVIPGETSETPVRMGVDETGNLMINTTGFNSKVYVNALDVEQLQATLQAQQSAIDEQLSVKASQQAAIQGLESTKELLSGILQDVPCRTLNPLYFPPHEYTYVPTFGAGVHVAINESGLLANEGAWRLGVLANNGLIYHMPLHPGNNSILVINPAINQVHFLPFDPDLYVDDGWGNGVQADNGKLYFMPVVSPNVIVLDPNNNNQISAVATSGFPANATKWTLGIKARDGNIYSAPFSATAMLIIDPQTDTIDTESFAGFPDAQGKWLGTIQAPNNLLYGLPFNYDYVLVVNLETMAVDYSSIPVETGKEKWFGGVLADNGKIYGIPFSVTKVLVVDTSRGNAVSYISVMTNANPSWASGVRINNGKIMAFPVSSPAILFIDPETDTADTTSVSSLPNTSAKWWGGVYVPRYNRLFASPFLQMHVLQIDLDVCV